MNLYSRYIKRILDVVCSLILLIVLSPLLLIISLLIRVKLGAPVIFRQDRPGKANKIFKMYKFRTMTNEKDENGDLLPNEQRHTKFGKLLRSLSIDELPELLNVLKGDMSLVGPRPLLKEYLPLYNAHQAKRHNVLPGITGYAQVNGRNSISWEEKFDLDVEYVEKISFVLDCKILIQTIFKVFIREGINSNEQVTMEKFKGSK